MAGLLDLPTETLILIFLFLGDIDLQTLVLSQSTCRCFHKLIQSSYPFSPSKHAHVLRVDSHLPNPLLGKHFDSLFDSGLVYCERRPYYYNYEQNAYRAFELLPWAKRTASREIFMRHEASWRRMSLSASNVAIKRVHVLRATQAGYLIGRFDIHIQAESPDGSGLTMGMYFDLLLRAACYYLCTPKWKLYVRRRPRPGAASAIEEPFPFEITGPLLDEAPADTATITISHANGPSQTDPPKWLAHPGMDGKDQPLLQGPLFEGWKYVDDSRSAAPGVSKENTWLWLPEHQQYKTLN